MKKFFSLTLVAMICSIASFALTPITGDTSTCIGTPAYVMDSASAGGSWSSSNPSVAIIDTMGYITGISAGTTIITYTRGGSFVTENFTVYAGAATITGNTSFCVGSSSQLSDATPGGTWTSSNPTVATVSVSGLVYGASGGGAYIYYSTGGPCNASVYVSVNTTSVGTITGPTTVCAAGGVIALNDTTLLTSGTWSSSNPAIATVDVTTGVVTGVTVGTVTITYATSGTCGGAYTTQVINVVNTTNPGYIYGATGVNIGATTTLYDNVVGLWSSSNPAVATIDSITGVVTGISAGTDVITYTVNGCGGSADTTYTITVSAINGISGNVNFTGTAVHGNVKVWLITYNAGTGDLEALDSTVVSTNTGGTSAYYQFLSVATDSYRVKAAVMDSLGITTTGYIPTYHTSSFYWYSANVIAHVSGTADINEDINMAYGTVTSGPGFIGGNVSAGANRGTSGTGINVVGMNVNLLNSSNQLIQSVRTNSTGNYSFSNLPLGTYYVFPDSLNYYTTAYTGITLISGAANMSFADFIQHTVSKTIQPNVEGVNNISNTISSVFTFPNPTNGKLNLQWNEQATEKGTIILTDITGREIYKTTINMTAGTGIKQLDLSGLVNGLYMISVKSGAINYNNKIQIQH